jgi:prepilin-type N-terminal cleavage/methylation domain-containing protein
VAIALKELTPMQDRRVAKKETNGGFSLIELVIAMAITLVIMSVASTLLATSFRIRSRENARTDSIADVQRGLNIMARELAIGGYGFDPSSNGLVSGDCDNTSIRVRSNLNRYSDGSTTIESASEDVKYVIDTTNGQNYLVRYDRFATGSQSTVLANRVDNLDIIYWSPTNTALNVAADPSQVANAIGVRITVSVNLPAVGTRGSPGYQPATTMQLSSDVTLRNKSQNLTTY